MSWLVVDLYFRGFSIVLEADCLSWSYQVCASFYLRFDSLPPFWAMIMIVQALFDCTNSVPDLVRCWSQGIGCC